MIKPMFQGNEFFNTQTATHYEYLVDTRSEMSSLTTDDAYGSVALVTEDFSFWILGNSGGTKAWLEVE